MQQHVLMTVLGNSWESPLSPSAPDSLEPSLISLAPNFCFSHHLCPPLLPYLGILFLVSYMVFNFVNSFDLHRSVSGGDSFG